MSTVLIVDDDLGLQKILGLSLQKYSDEFNVLFAAHGEEAVVILEQQTVDLLVTDIKMPKMDGLALLSHMSVNYPSVPCIVLTSYTIPGLEQRLSRSIFRFLKKPVNPVDLAGLIRGGLEQAGKDGTLSGVSLAGLMQIVEAEEKTCVLVVYVDGRKQGKMYFQGGVLYDAVSDKLQGEDAALQLIALEDAQLKYQKLFSKNIAQRIETGMQALILEAMRIKDEKKASGGGQQEDDSRQQDELLAEGIRLCEGLYFQKAQKILLQAAAQDPNNAQVWLWLSRTLHNMKQLRLALSKAYKQSPKDQHLAHDIRMFHKAAKMGLEQIRRCPFCYAPLDVQGTHCHFCGGVFLIKAEELPSIGKNVDRRELQAALVRFESVLARELNIPVLFYAALVCLNLNDFDAVLEYLEQLQQCVDPNESPYTVTVARIVAFIASRHTAGEMESDSAASNEKSPVMAEVSKQKKVLVVEDSPTTRKVIKMTLQGNDFDVIEAEDGVEALTKINDEQPDLILLDVMLPKLDGYGILSVLKQNSGLKGVPVIMLTSKDGLKDRIKGRFSSASAYLTKPFKPEVLLAKVHQYIQ